MRRLSALFLSENQPTFPALEPKEFLELQEVFMKTGLTRKQKVTEFYFSEHDDLAEIYTHNTD